MPEQETVPLREQASVPLESPATAVTSLSTERLSLSVVRAGRAVREAQQLRFRVFREALGARFVGAGEGLDEDRFDRHCHHVVVREGEGGAIVGTTRLLTEDSAAAIGGFYGETEFDWGSLLARPGRTLEVGRTCVDPKRRDGAVIAVLWRGVAEVMAQTSSDTLIGCASIPLSHGVSQVRALVQQLNETYAPPGSGRAVPYQPLPNMVRLRAVVACRPPPLVKAYLRLGAWICGDAAWDARFQCADLPILLERRRIDRRYARHFLKTA